MQDTGSNSEKSFAELDGTSAPSSGEINPTGGAGGASGPNESTEQQLGEVGGVTS